MMIVVILLYTFHINIMWHDDYNDDSRVILIVVGSTASVSSFRAPLRRRHRAQRHAAARRAMLGLLCLARQAGGLGCGAIHGAGELR